ncbi:fibronectin type-III domain-containing protein 3A [Hemicordylus capensis]|uniref:fibronectin type-III domain-containing protein 3A n=1 Tax=Hemicordylus capensis TaxID=884348 RepID=UPI0023025813|nr:fibronectin type-III domain-containing protein 3A [Hemicordylus capensis]XP_053129617.1 fibronectin type-III domain-containing protein 3A [Hemicordylus capensis]XP_053129618.1 fibronectin type-III domain-containing protein 3A [Hemicordylus capensis]XP_053129619.1 fibronectin type-III domain-containing protein 3A [Hemicordylus capensis]
MVILAMMADQPPPLEATPILNEVPLLPHMVNGDTAQQVILVQVNPGETFTIRTEDGHIQCIQGPAHVPMMSPNGSVPPIFVPPGYVSQMVEENGVRKVIVMPHSTEFHPSMHPPPPHVPHYMHPHPALLPHPPHPVYPPVPGTGELPPQFVHQHPPPPPPSPHVYQEQESRSHARTNFAQRDERTLKMQEHLKKRLKDRQASGHANNKMNSPPSSPHKVHNSSSASVQNGFGKGQQGTGGPIKQKQVGKTRGSPLADAEMGESDTESRKSQEVLSISKPIVSEIQARSAVLSWSPPVASQNGETPSASPATFTYEVAISNSGKNGKFKSIYVGEEIIITLPDLRPATDYHVRVSASSSSIKEMVSELVSFTTESCEPDPPAAPKVVSKTKNSLNLQWKSSNDNGSKITSYLLEWDEGKSGAFKECYYGHLKQHKVTKLTPSTKYTFRLAAKNDIGMSGFSETLICYTIGIVPPPPPPPRLTEAGVTWLSLEWSPPSGVSSDDSLTYTLETEEEGSDYGFQAGYNGDELSCTLKDLRRSTAYKFRVFAHNTEGKSGPSEVVEYSTSPDKPGPPSKPAVKGKIHPHNVKVTWDPPKDNGGSDISAYILDISEVSTGSKWETAYSGPTREHVCAHLKPGTCYRLRVCCIGRGGQSQASDVLTVQTAAIPPGPCLPPGLSGKAKPKEVTLQWDPPSADGGSEVTEYIVEVANSDQDERRQAYRGQALECTVNGLLPGRTYCFWIRAANKAGLGPCSEKAEISTAPGPPDPCCVSMLTCKTATCIVATWESPACNGAEVTEYRLEWGQVEGSMHIVYSGPLLSYEVKGLTPATTYYCRVQAVNIAGVGLFGEIGMVTTPASVPAAVAVLHLLEEDQTEAPLPLSTCLSLHWEEPCCHGAEILGYHIEYGEKQLSTVSRVTSHVLENLQPDTLYRIRIQAFNGLGAGPFSPSIKAKTKPLPPDPPHLECVVFSYQSLKLKWGEGPSRALIANPTQFNLQMEDRFGRFIMVYSGPCHTYKVQRLSESTTYYFKIQACNDAGEGKFSEVYAFATTKSPPPALKAPKVHQLGDNTCEVTWEPLQPMKGDSIVYILQLAIGREVDQAYKGPETSFRFSNLQTNCEYRFRVCAGRQYQDTTGPQELHGPYSPSTVFSSQKPELVPQCSEPSPDLPKSRRKALSDEQFAFLLLVGFAAVAIVFAVIIQYFVIK